MTSLQVVSVIIVLRSKNNYLLVQRNPEDKIFPGKWQNVGGKIEPGEDVKQGAIREIKEEMGIDITIKDKLGENEYISSDPEKGKLRKQVNYFLAEAPHCNLKLGPSGGLDEARWFKLSEIADLRLYDDVIPFITKGIKLLNH